MIPLFLGLTLVNLLGLGATVTLGYARAGHDPAAASRHILVGALATIVCCGVHCVVFTYFVATAKWVQHAITVKHLDPALAAPTRSFKAQAFPAALLAMASVFAAAVMGAAADNYAGPWPARHHAAAWLAVAVNLAVAVIEYRAIARNGRLIDDLLARLGTGAEPAEIR
jgi:hypothetical protein